MPRQYRVILTNDALADIAEIAAYIRADSPDNSALVCERILKVFDGLESMPGRFKARGGSRSRRTPVHVAMEKPFLIYYTIVRKSGTVFVLRVRHGARRQPRRFP